MPWNDGLKLNIRKNGLRLEGLARKLSSGA
jgi:hypothetical protein